jgi:acetyltransferase EpsM
LTKRLVLVGGGGFAKEVAEIARLTGHDLVGYLAPDPGIVEIPHLGYLEWLAANRDSFDATIIAFGAVDRRSLAQRVALTHQLEANGIAFATLVSPHAVVSAGVELGAGSFVAHAAVISVDARIGRHVIINSAAIIGHDAEIGAGAIIAPGAFLGGNVTVGEGSLIGPGAQVLEARAIGRGSIVSVGSVVLRSVGDGATVLPARVKIL